MKIVFSIVLFAALLVFADSSIASDSTKLKSTKFYSIHLNYQNGKVLPTNEFVRGANGLLDEIDDFQAFSLEFAKNTTGEKLWEQLYGYPEWGAGIFMADFFNNQEVGYPIALYGFLNAPVKRWNNLSLNFKIAFGFTFNWEGYHPVENKYNTAIGTDGSVYIEAGLNLEYRFKRLGVNLKYGFTHFSNGNLRKPNFGINTMAPGIGIKYHLQKRNPSLTKMEVPVFKKRNEFLVSVFGGAKNLTYNGDDIDIITRYKGVYFPVFGVSTSFNRQLGYKIKIGFGATTTYDGTVNARIIVEDGELDAVDVPFVEKFSLSVYPSFEFVVNKLSLILQPGLYIYRKKFENQTPAFYQRIGLRHQFVNGIFVGINLRSYEFYKSDYIELNVGFSIRGKK